MRPVLEGFRTLLVLGRVSNLPTVWSNLIVGWILADGPRVDVVRRAGYNGPNDTIWPLLFVLIGGSFLYVGGMYLNDFCDAAFDARYCPARPIPSGKISRRLVGLLATLWFTVGYRCFVPFGPVTIGFALVLIAVIVLYDFHHKNVAWAPLVMSFCRCLLYLLAFSSFRESDWFGNDYGDWLDDALNYLSILGYLRNDSWAMALDVINFFPTAIPLGLYVAGIAYLARGESRPGKTTRWPLLLLLLAVIVLAHIYGIFIGRFDWLLVRHPHEFLLFLVRLLVPCLFLPGWMVWLLIPFWRGTRPSVGRVVSGLLAGIVLLDMIVISLQVGPHAFILFPLFLLALLLQRMIPAT
ncbi:MAG TPA: UbiA family prenyltransferase [Candidatus Methylacidiphilales bacterium]|nr:UbiA family prenyltransferase [Candidatus Methylacidiphilales bacterium]